MATEQIVLHFETASGRFPDSRIAAQALLDWIALAEAAAEAIAPGIPLSIEIVGGATPGSTRFPQLLRWADDRVSDVKLAWSEYPHLRSMVVGGAHTLWTATIAAAVSVGLAPDQQTVALSDVDRAILADLKEQAAKSSTVAATSQRLYRTLEKEPAIVGVGVADDWSKKPSLIVPRSEFPERGGLWEPQQSAPEEQVIRDEWSVVLLRPVLQASPHAWRFSRDGLPFSAMMHDAKFLSAMRDGKIPINLQEGVMMRVEVEHTVRLNGQVWEPVPRSWRIVRVLSPTPLP